MSQKPLRILQVLRAPIGGLYRHVIDLSTGLIAHGHEVGIVMDSTISDTQTDARLAPILEKLALGVHRMPMARLLSLSDLAAPVRLRRLARKLGAEILHGHGSKGGLYARLARTGKSRAALYTPHGGVLNFEPTSFAGWAFRRAENLLLPRTDAIIFESRFAYEAFTGQIGMPSCPAPVIYNGLGKSEFEPVRAKRGARDFVFIGELRGAKGVRVLLSAMSELTRPDGKPATLIMAGGGPLRGEIEASIAEMGLERQVTLAGVQPARKMLAEGRCLVVPSLAESLPYVILEGAAADKPVIATDVGGIKEIFGPTAPSLLPAGDVPALKGAMQDFLNDETAARSEADRRLKHVRAHFAVEKMVGEIEALYYDVLKARRGENSQ